MKRVYDQILADHFTQYEQMVFLCGPRQVGKTTMAHNATHLNEQAFYRYFNWDDMDDRGIILEGKKKIIESLPLDAILSDKPMMVFDEIHKYKRWKTFLKGFVDAYKEKLHILVTGSAKLNVFRRGGDSLMGRYFLYRAHPLSVGELLKLDLPTQEYTIPQKIASDIFDNLYQLGGFPEPFIKQEVRFYNRWQNLRQQQIIYEDIRDLAQIQELAQLEILAELLKHQSSHTVVYRELAKKVRVAETTIKRWVNVLESFYYCFTLRPWTKNITRSLIKEPKIYLWDWSTISDAGSRLENFVASHLLKYVHGLTDLGFGDYKLYFLRDKEQREVDFLIAKDNQPWLMVEVKSSGREPLSRHLMHFQAQINAPHVLQVAHDLPFVEVDCFSLKTPTIVPLTTFLSQLL